MMRFFENMNKIIEAIEEEGKMIKREQEMKAQSEKESKKDIVKPFIIPVSELTEELAEKIGLSKQVFEQIKQSVKEPITEKEMKENNIEDLLKEIIGEDFKEQKPNIMGNLDIQDMLESIGLKDKYSEVVGRTKETINKTKDKTEPLFEKTVSKGDFVQGLEDIVKQVLKPIPNKETTTDEIEQKELELKEELIKNNLKIAELEEELAMLRTLSEKDTFESKGLIKEFFELKGKLNPYMVECLKDLTKEEQNDLLVIATSVKILDYFGTLENAISNVTFFSSIGELLETADNNKLNSLITSGISKDFGIKSLLESEYVYMLSENNIIEFDRDL